jgi:hypothetical protein
MVIMREDATAEEITHILEEMRKYGVNSVLIRIPVESFKNNFEEKSR